MGLFHERVKCLESLQTINIFFGHSWMADLNLEKLRQGLKELSQIKRFTVSCTNHEVGYYGIKSLGNIFKRLVSLEELRLGLERCKNMNDLGLMALSQGFGRCRALKMLRLDLPGGKNITNEGLESLSESLSKMSSLESLEIIFKTDRLGINVGLQKFCQSLGGLKSLRYLRLCFPW